MRPAEVCGEATKPKSSRSAMTLRMVADDRLKSGIPRQGSRSHRLAVANVVLDQGLEQQLRPLIESLVGTFCHSRSI